MTRKNNFYKKISSLIIYMEVIARNVEDHLIDSLNYKLSPSASYIQSRRSSTFFPAGSNHYSPTGTRVIKIPISSESGWLDPATLRIQFDLLNSASVSPPSTDKLLRPLSGPWCFYQRARLLLGSQILEDISDYNRLHEMFHLMLPKHVQENLSIEGFGMKTLKQYNLDNEAFDSETFGGISAGSSRTVLFRPLFGLLNQEKYLPLRFAGGLVIELEVVSDSTEPVVVPMTTGFTFSDTNTSTSWVIQNVQCKADTVYMDSQLEEHFSSHMRDGGSLDLAFNTYISQTQSITGKDVDVNVQRAVSRLKSVYCTLYQTPGLTQSSKLYKFFNLFHNPNYNNQGNRTPEDEISFQLSVGNTLFPDYPSQSLSEQWYQLVKSLGIHGSTWHSIGINPYGTNNSYASDSYILGVDTEKCLGASFTGIESRSGSLMHVRLKKGGSDNLGERLNIVLVADMVVKIRATGVEVFE